MANDPNFVDTSERATVLEWLLSHDPNARALYVDSAVFRQAIDLLCVATIPALVVGYARQAEQTEREFASRWLLREAMMKGPDPDVVAAFEAAIQASQVHLESKGILVEDAATLPSTTDLPDGITRITRFTPSWKESAGG